MTRGASDAGDLAAPARPVCLHVTGDFPDPFGEAKTPVIRTLVELVAGRFDNRVLSINRVSPRASSIARSLIRPDRRARIDIETAGFEYGTAIRYFAPPGGLFHATNLIRLGDWLADRLEREGKPDLLMAHKLTIEGLVVERAARRLNIPYAVSIQGNTDCRILAYRPDLHRHYRRIFHEAAAVFALAPWALETVERTLGKTTAPAALLPCPTDLDEALPPSAGDGTLVSVFHLENWRGKNLPGMANACALLARDGNAPALEIIGGGDRRATERCLHAIGGAPAITLSGPLGREALRERMHRASGFVLPSLRESFGLVFVEALFAGLPIVYPAGAAVDGYFDGLPFALRVDPRSPGEIAAAMHKLIRDERELKAALADWQTSREARRFTRPAIADTLARGLASAMRQSGGRAGQ